MDSKSILMGIIKKPLESEINSIGEIDEALLQHLVVYFSRDYDDGESLALDAYKQRLYTDGVRES